MHFVYNVNFTCACCRRIFYTLPQLPNVLYAIIGSSVDLYYVYKCALFYGTAVGTNAARFFVAVRSAIHGFCQDSRRGCLSGSSGSAEQIRMSHGTRGNLIF